VKSTRSYLVLFFALTTVGALAVVYKQYLDIIALGAGRSGADAALQAKLGAAENLIQQLRAELAAARAPTRLPAGQPEVAIVATNPAQGSRVAEMRARMKVLQDDPKYQKLVALEQKAALDFRYGALFKQLNLSPAQLDQLKNLLLQREQAQGDALQAARDQGINFRDDPQALRQAVSDAQSSADDQIKAALGDAGYAAYQQYEQTGTERALAGQLQQSLSYTAAPLTDDQSRQLVQILAQSGASSAGSGGGGAPAPVTDQVISQAAAVLSPPQLQALQELQARQQAQQQIRQMLQSTQGRTPGTPGGG